MMGHREQMKSGDEYDALTRWKRFCHFRPGKRKAIKRKLNKRQRRRPEYDIDEGIIERGKHE